MEPYCWWAWCCLKLWKIILSSFFASENQVSEQTYLRELLEYPCNWKQMFCFPSTSSSSVWACEFPVNVCPDKEQSCFTSLAAADCKHRWEAGHTGSWGWEVWFGVWRWGLSPHTSSRVSPPVPVLFPAQSWSFYLKYVCSGHSSQSPDFLHSRQISIDLPVPWQKLCLSLAPCVPDPEVPQLFSVVWAFSSHCQLLSLLNQVFSYACVWFYVRLRVTKPAVSWFSQRWNITGVQ